MSAFIFLAVLLLLIALGMPIAFALLFSGVAVMFQLGQFDSQIVVQNAIGGADNFVLMAVPFFILAGEFMNAGGLICAVGWAMWRFLPPSCWPVCQVRPWQIPPRWRPFWCP